MLKRITGNVFAVFVIFIVLALIIPLNEVMGGALLDFQIGRASCRERVFGLV